MSSSFPSNSLSPHCLAALLCVYPDTPRRHCVLQVINDVVVRRLTESFVDGFNACLLIVGEAKSARDQLFAGASGGRKGLVPLVMRDVFNEIAQAAAKSEPDGVTRATVSVSFWELHNERIVDLLKPSNKSLAVCEDTTRGYYVHGLSSSQVCDISCYRGADGFKDTYRAIIQCGASLLPDCRHMSAIVSLPSCGW